METSLVWWVGCLRVVTTDPGLDSADVRIVNPDGSLVWSGSVTLGPDDVETVDWPVALALDPLFPHWPNGWTGWEVVESRGGCPALADGAREVAVGSRDAISLGLPDDTVLTLEVRHGLVTGPDYVIKTADGYRVGISTPRPDRLTGLLPMVRAALAAAGAV